MGKSVEYYLSKGLDQKMAEYFSAGRKKLTGVAPADSYSLLLTFEGGERRVYSVAPLLQENTVFAPLKDPAVFRRVYLDEDCCVAWDKDPCVDSSVVWSNRINLDPDTCYVDSTPIAE